MQRPGQRAGWAGGEVRETERQLQRAAEGPRARCWPGAGLGLTGGSVCPASQAEKTPERGLVGLGSGPCLRPEVPTRPRPRLPGMEPWPRTSAGPSPAQTIQHPAGDSQWAPADPSRCPSKWEGEKLGGWPCSRVPDGAERAGTGQAQEGPGGRGREREASWPRGPQPWKGPSSRGLQAPQGHWTGSETLKTPTGPRRRRTR